MMTIWKKFTFFALGISMVLGTGLAVALTKTTQNVKAANSLYTSCDFTLKTANNNLYNNTWAYGTDWSVYGAGNNAGAWTYAKFGGKSATLATANPTYVNNVNALGSAINQISISLLVGTLGTGMGINSWGVRVYSDAALTTKIDESSLTSLTKPTASIVYNFAPSTAYQTANSTTEWPTASYFKVFFDCTNTSTSNGIIWVDKINFYKNAPFVAVDSVSITDPGTSALTVGTPITLTANVSPSDATDKTVTWTSSPTDVVRVLSNGQVIPCNNGSTTITATSVSDNTKSASLTFMVSGQDLSTSTKTITTTSLGLAATYVNGYFGSGTTFSLRGVMAKTVGGELQFGNNAGAGQGLLYNVSSYGAKIYSIVTNAGADGASAASALYVGSTANPATTLVTPTVAGTVATYNVATLGDYYFFSFAITATSVTNYYNSIAVIVDEAEAYAQQFLSSTDTQCAALAVTLSSWSSLQTSFESLSGDSKNALLLATANVNGTYVQKAAARYDYIVQKYGYSNFINRNYLNAKNVDTLNENPSSLIGVGIISIISIGLVGAYFFFCKKKKNIS